MRFNLSKILIKRYFTAFKMSSYVVLPGMEGPHAARYPRVILILLENGKKCKCMHKINELLADWDTMLPV